MADNNSEPSSKNAEDQTDNSTSATDQDSKQEVTPENDKVTLNKSDYQKLVSQRDKNFEESRTVAERLDIIEAERARDEYIDQFLNENKKDYKYVEPDDLKSGTSPEEIEAIAKRIQTKAEKVEQQTMEKFQEVTGPPVLTGEAKEQKLQELRKLADEGKPGAFEQWVELDIFAKQ